MNHTMSIFGQIWDRSTLLAVIGIIFSLLIGSLIVVGTSLKSGLIWLMLAAICVAWTIFCTCSNCKKVRNLRCRRTSERSDTISTLSDLNDLSQIAQSHPIAISDPVLWAHDLPPSYDVVNSTTEQQPPSYASVMALMNASNNRQFNFPSVSELPPPYIDDLTVPLDIVTIANDSNLCNIAIANNCNMTITSDQYRPEESVQQPMFSLSENRHISTISHCNLSENTQKVLDNSMSASADLAHFPYSPNSLRRTDTVSVECETETNIPTNDQSVC